MHSFKSIYHVLWPILFFCINLKIFGKSLIPVSLEAKQNGGTSQTIVKGPLSLFYNPANLIFSSKLTSEIDFSIAKVKYSFTALDRDPTFIETVVPPLALGVSSKIYDNLFLGCAFIPTGTGEKISIPSVPIETAPGSITNVDIETKEFGYVLSGGLAYKFLDFLSLGLSVLNTTKETDIVVTPFLENSSKGSAYQFIFGGRVYLLSKQIILGGSYKTEANNEMEVKSSGLLVGVTQNQKQKMFLPMATQLGIEFQKNNLSLFTDMGVESWSRGRNDSGGSLTGNSEIDYLDSYSFSVGGKIEYPVNHRYGLAFGYITGSKGNGTSAAEGIRFGEFEAIPRWNLSLGYRYRVSQKLRFDFAGNIIQGSQIVPEEELNSGVHEISAYLVSMGLTYHL